MFFRETSKIHHSELREAHDIVGDINLIDSREKCKCFLRETTIIHHFFHLALAVLGISLLKRYHLVTFHDVIVTLDRWGPGAITVEICPFSLLEQSNDYLG